MSLINVTVAALGNSSDDQKIAFKLLNAVTSLGAVGECNLHHVQLYISLNFAGIGLPYHLHGFRRVSSRRVCPDTASRNAACKPRAMLDALGRRVFCRCARR